MTDFPLVTAANSVFVLVSFEGPDPYSQAGGLGVRMTGLAHTLAQLGYETHSFFVGDPKLPGEERRLDGRLILHRWCQWLSHYYPAGVYDGEEAKLSDFTNSFAPYVIDNVIVPTIASGRTPVVLFEEWQTAESTCILADELQRRGLRDPAVLFWNANNTYGFERINWTRLASAATITAVSRYMRAIIRAAGADAFVIPNGISEELLAPVSRGDVRAMRPMSDDAGIGTGAPSGMFFKMARWERSKGWTQALDAVRAARDNGSRLVLVGRGGGPSNPGGGANGVPPAPPAQPLVVEAEERGLRGVQIESEDQLRTELHPLVRGGADVISLGFGVSPALARTLYAASDGVLANSVSEPFGLVGLEAMAAGGVAYTGGTGEDYAVTGRNAVVLETLDPMEILESWESLAASTDRTAKLRREARKTAREYVWPRVVGKLLAAIACQAQKQTAA